jgi:hypothetical protein
MKSSLSTVVVLSSFLVAVAGCSTEAPSETPSGSEAEVQSGGVCSTLDYGPRLAPDEYYQYFATDAEAAAWVGKLLAGQPETGTLEEITHDARLNRLVSEIFEGFKQVFRRETAGLPSTPPRVVILKKDAVNAFALGPVSVDGSPAKSPWLFFVNTKLLAMNADDNELRGVFAHELGHLIVRTFLPEVARRVRAVYMINGSEDGVLGEAQETNPALEAHVEDILKHQLRVGGIANLAMPVAVSLNPPAYLRMIQVLADNGAHHTPASPACARIQDDQKALNDTQVALLPGLDEGLLVPRTPTATEAAELDKLATKVGDDIRACVDGVPDQPSFLQLVAKFNGLPVESADPSNPRHGELVAIALPSELRIDTDMPGASLTDRVLRADAVVRAELEALQNDPTFPIEKLRVYDSEEDADDASIRVLRAIGQDPTGVGQFFMHFLPTEARERCRRAVASEQNIPYGNLMDAHPATCWRYYHSTQFANGLAQCTAHPALARTPKGSGLPSVAEQAPRERGFESYDKTTRGGNR